MFITRKKVQSGFKYSTTDNKHLERIKNLKIPPMWTDVKISYNEKDKVQATGYDSKNRKQYIYNKKFLEKSRNKKFDKMNSFDYNKYSRVIKHYVSRNDLSKECVIANVIKLMEDLCIRVGNESYKKENGSYGITTLLKKHLKNNKLNFIGKKGIEHTKKITNPCSISFINRVLSIKGPNLFYYKPNGTITSSDLNSFLKEKVQSNITCKDIRTYCANKLFNHFMRGIKLANSERKRKDDVNKGIDYTAKELGNTRKVCRDSYLCPKNINKYLLINK